MAFNFASLKLQFFDAPGVLKKVRAGKRRAFGKLGAFVRRRAKSSIRRRKKTSPVGQPPSSHAGQLRDLIFFAWDDRSESVVVGPVPFSGGRAQSVGAPQLLEHGGDTTRRAKSGASRRLHYGGNPFMAPALEAERPKFVEQFKNLL